MYLARSCSRLMLWKSSLALALVKCMSMGPTPPPYTSQEEFITKLFRHLNSGYMIYVDILSGGNLFSIQVANMEDLIYWSVRSSSKWEGDGRKWVKWGDLLFYPAESVTLSEYIKMWCNIQWTYGLSCNDYRVVTVSKLYPEIIMQSLKAKDNFNMS